MVLGIIPLNVFAEEPARNVTLVGQWIDDSSKKEDTPKQYNLDDKIGAPLYNSGLLRGLAKQFLGWSDKAPVGNGVLADGARLFSPEDKISVVFGNSIPKDAKIYAVYYEINNPYGAPFPQDPFSLIALGGVLENLKDRVNKNSLSINENVSPDEVLKNTNNVSSDDVIVDQYVKKNDIDDINEVVLESEFQMDWVVAMLAYRNKAGSNAIRPILSYDYKDRYENNNFPTKDKKDAGYTYVDLNMDFGTDEGLVIPDNLFLEFKSYAWRPLYAFGIKDDGSKEVLNILGLDGSDKGNNTDAFNDLVSGADPRTKFGVKTNGNREITIRVILREWDNHTDNSGFNGERIPESNIPKGPEGTISSEIVSNMTLNVLGSNEGIKPESIVKISDEKAKELADGNAQDNIKITGSIEGHVFASAGSVSAFGRTVPLVQDVEIKKHDIKEPVKLSYVHKKEEHKPEPKPEPKDESQIIFFAKPKAEEKKIDKFNHIAYIEGYEDNTVRANGKLTRAEAAAMVTRLAELDLSNKSKADYKDLEDNAWYLPYINAALKAGMLDAENGNLRPNDNITRAEFAKMLAAIDKNNNYVSEFKDIAGHKYEKEINKITGNKRVEGYEDGTFRPDGYLTRAEAASFLNRMFDRVADDVAIKGFENIIMHFNDLNVGDWYYYEIIEASNTHELFRRGGTDKFDRAFEEWTNVFNTKVR